MRLFRHLALWTIISVTIPTFTLGQKTKEPYGAPPTLTDRELKKEASNHDCKARGKFTVSERLGFYPFTTATEIRLASFDYKADTADFEYQLPEINGEVDLLRLKESKTLSKRQIDSLTYLLFNVGYRGKILTMESTGCYNPRNAILFIDSDGKAFEFIGLCFECSGLRLSSDKIKTGEFCNQKYEMIKDFFRRHGVEFGTIEEVR